MTLFEDARTPWAERTWVEVLIIVAGDLILQHDRYGIAILGTHCGIHRACACVQQSFQDV